MRRARALDVQQQTSRRRIAALVIAIGGHIGLVLLLVRPAPAWRSSMKRDSGTASALELRFIRNVRPSVEPTGKIVPPKQQSAFSRFGSTKRLGTLRTTSLMPGQSTHSNDRQTAGGRLVVHIPDAQGVEGNPGYDGDFMARLRAAKRADVVHGCRDRMPATCQASI